MGVVVDGDLKFNSHTHAAVAGANQTLGIIKHTITSRSPAIVTYLFKSLVGSRLEYGMLIAISINKIDKMALKSIQRWVTKCIISL